ncbi:MAG: PAS domain-containing sensor histidine kinase [Pseudomonadales bacterium]
MPGTVAPNTETKVERESSRPVNALSIDNSQMHEAEQTLRIFGLYRIVLAALILGVFLVQMTTTVESAYKPNLFLFTIGTYFLLSVIAHFYAGLKQQSLSNLELFCYFFLVDIGALTLIAYASGGLSTGLSLIMTLTVACGGIFFRDKLALLVAALASIATLLNVSYLVNLGVVENNLLVNAGVQGAIFFATVLLVQLLVERIESSQRLATERARELAHSEYLNQLIVRRMQTGVLVVDRSHDLHSANDSALSMLNLSNNDKQLPEPLLKSMTQWQQRPDVRTRPFRIRKAGALLQSEFMPLAEQDEGQVLIFLEDTSRTRQQAQQIKLASLGRLTASIAHEIRNPLGAISHAAQLLNESENISDEDRRLCDIVTSHSSRMNRIVENVLQLSRRRASKPERFELNAWLKGFVAQMQQSYPDSEIALSDNANTIKVAFDPSHLDQVLSNVCSNGLRYSEKRIGVQRIRIFANANVTDKLPIIDIEDDGDGVPTEHIDQLFEPFHTSEASGTGLGLFIARELCEANQSRLDYLPTREGKSCFRITFAHPMKKLATEE